MLKKIKEIAKSTSLYDYIKIKRQKRVLAMWEKNMIGKKGPLPHILKQYTVKDYAYKYGCSTLVETGTFEGDMVKATLTSFKKIYSIELDESLYKRAVNKFRKYPHVKIIQGDSGQKLKEIMYEVTTPCVFWLDGHYSAGSTAKGQIDTPIATEIETILSHAVKDHIILIDDARCFDGTNDYPVLTSFIAELRKRRPGMMVEVYNDIIRITPDKNIVIK